MIEKSIHEILADVSNPAVVALSALLPIDRIVTGAAHGRDLPYACLNLESNLPEYRSNKGAMRRPSIRFQVWHESHSDGCAIRDAIVALFENKTFETTDLILYARHGNDFAIEEPDGVWQFVIDIETKIKER